MRQRRRVILATAVIGLGLSGFFDGILLHQILQWHHLLSLVAGETFRDLRTQVLADGLFHVLMYLITAFGLWLLWRARAEAAASSWRTTGGGLLLGFGLWNVIDVGFFHWTLGIHRIRVGVPDPLLYDLGWLAAFGLVPLIAARLMLHERRPTSSSRISPLLAVALLALVSAVVAALPPPGSRTAVVLLAPGTTAATAFNAAVEARIPVLWAAPEGGMMVVRATPGSDVRLYRAGALFVTRSPAVAGCMAALEA